MRHPTGRRTRSWLGGATALVLVVALLGCDRTDGARAECLGRAQVLVLSGTFTTEQRTDRHFPDGGTLDARGATVRTTGSYPIHLADASGADACLVGGTVVGTLDPTTTSWATFHGKTGVLLRTVRPTVVGTRITNVGDGIRIGKPTPWVIQGASVTQAHDDCVENDQMATGTIDESLFDGCYAFLSGTDDNNGIPVDGTGRTVTITSSLVRMQPMDQVFRGPTPGHGPLWKLGYGPLDGQTGIAPRIGISDTIIRVDQMPSHGTLEMPTYDHDGDPGTPRISYLDEDRCANNTIVWLGGDPALDGADMPGAGTYPSSCFRFTSDVGVWDRAVADWHAAHG